MLLAYETKLWKSDKDNIAGVDEVGRGCLAGPFVAAAVVLDKKHFINNDVIDQEIRDLYNQIKDSKKLTPKRRKELSEFIKIHALDYSIEIIDNTKIDEWGISKCTQIAFFNTVKNLKIKADHIFTDSFKINALPEECQTNIIGGDGKSISIAAASIVAKVFRDDLMEQLHDIEEYQVYGFNKHKGYGTKIHLEMISRYGICDLHRRSFSPIIHLI